MIAGIIVVAYFIAFVLGAGAMWNSRGNVWMYALTFASTAGALAFCAMYASGGFYRFLISVDPEWAAAHINSAIVLCGFHYWRLRRPV